VPQTGVSFEDAKFMTPLPVDTLTKKRKRDYEGVAGELPSSTTESSDWERDHKT